MDYAEMYYQIVDLEYILQCSEKEYQKYVAIGPWSDEICYRVDILKKTIEETTKKIASLKAVLKENEMDY